MAPLIVLLVAWPLFRVVAFAVGWEQVDSRSAALRFAFATMFVFTAVSHFHPKSRPDLILMVPVIMPVPHVLVTVTGILELLGAIGLVLPQSAAVSAYGLIALLLAMLPANVRAARAGLMVVGRRATPLMFRVPLQLVWIGALWWVARDSPPH